MTGDTRHVFREKAISSGGLPVVGMNQRPNNPPSFSMKNRRHFLRAGLTAAAATLSLTRSVKAQETAAKAPPFKISLAGWSLHLAFFSKKLEHLDFPVIAKRDYGIEAVEYVN